MKFEEKLLDWIFLLLLLRCVFLDQEALLDRYEIVRRTRPLAKGEHNFLHVLVFAASLVPQDMYETAFIDTWRLHKTLIRPPSVTKLPEKKLMNKNKKRNTE